MSGFSIELAAEAIVDPRSRRYFSEVYSSYSNGNYRSTVVMLWSVAICDLLFKIDELLAKGDAAAAAIDKKIREMRLSSPNSPEWESVLIAEISRSTMLIDSIELENLRFLQKHRHVSAHPVLNPTYELFAPSREIARAHIRNVLESVLCKPALMSKKVFDAFVEDLEQLQTILPGVNFGLDDDDALRRYLDSKYFSRLPLTATEAIFRSLWRVTFKSADARSDENRLINLRALHLMLRKDAISYSKRIADDYAYFSDVGTSDSHLTHLLLLLTFEPQLYRILSDTAKVPLDAFVDKTEERRVLAVFRYAALLDDINGMSVRRASDPPGYELSSYAFSILYRIAKDNGLNVALIDFAIAHYISSNSYDKGDARFQLLRVCLSDLDVAHLSVLLKGIESNNQTYNRYRALADHAEIRARVQQVGSPDLDLTAFPNFSSNIKK